MRLALPALALFALVACSSEPAPAPTPAPTGTGVRNLVAAGFKDLALGPVLVGPQGQTVESTIEFEGRHLARVVSYVACPPPDVEETGTEAGDDPGECDPENQPEDAVFTYVHRVTPGEGADGPVLSFRTARRAAGFANTIGFDRDQAEAALGRDYAIRVSIDNGALTWRIERGDGWDAGEEITLFWQSTLPPEGPSEAYEVETSEGRSRATGPFPPRESPAEGPVDGAAGR
jgi:hypothetical protein